MTKSKTRIYIAVFFIACLAVLVALDHMIIRSNPDVLGYSMERLGEKLVAMVPEGKDAVRGIYEQFVSQVEAKEVSPEQVELLATNILNLSNQNATLSPEEAESFLAFSLTEPTSQVVEPVIAIDSVKSEVFGLNKRLEIKPKPPKEPVPAEKLKNLGKRLDILIKMNETIRPKLDKKELHFRYQVDNGITMYLDPEVRRTIPEDELKAMHKELSELQEQKILMWRENLSKEAQEMVQKRTEELKAIRELKRHEHHEKLRQSHIIAELKALETLKNLEVMGYTTAIQSDSLQKQIEKEIKKALEAATSKQ